MIHKLMDYCNFCLKNDNTFELKLNSDALNKDLNDFSESLKNLRDILRRDIEIYLSNNKIEVKYNNGYIS